MRSIRKAFDRKRVKALRQQLASMPNEVTTADGRTVAINDQVRGHFKAASQWLRENMPGSVEDIQAIHGMFAKEGGLLGALEKPGSEVDFRTQWQPSARVFRLARRSRLRSAPPRPRASSSRAAVATGVQRPRRSAASTGRRATRDPSGRVT